MAYTTINKSTDYFRIKTYTGNATANTPITWNETNNMQPDWLWFKNRSQAQSHAIFDVLRGVTKRLSSDSTGADSTELTNLDSFDTNGFTVDYEAIVNGNGNSMVAWGWKASGAGVSNTAGSITSTVSANTTAGFSIVSYTGNGTNGATVGHGLGTTPSMMIVKRRDAGSQNWDIYHKSIGATKGIRFTTAAEVTYSGFWNNTAPTSTLFTLGNDTEVNTGSGTYIAYCFAEVKGYSKFGSYTGNGSADGTFVYTGFKPAFVIMKRSDSADHWLIKDSVRDSFNVANKRIYPNQSSAEDTSVNASIDILSNGFKQRGSDTLTNGSGGTYIYMAFAEQPLVGTNNIPATAR